MRRFLALVSLIALFLVIATALRAIPEDAIIFTDRQTLACQTVRNRPCADFVMEYVNNAVKELDDLEAKERGKVYDKLSPAAKTEIDAAVKTK